jgi:hypothetical protein
VSSRYIPALTGQTVHICHGTVARVTPRIAEKELSFLAIKKCREYVDLWAPNGVRHHLKEEQ